MRERRGTGARTTPVPAPLTVLLAVLTALVVAGCGGPPAPVPGPPAVPVAAGAATGSTGDACGPPLPGFTRGRVAPPPGTPAGVGDLFAVVGGPPGAPAVVLAHGFPETWSTWRAVAADLAADHRVIVPDLTSVGCSPLRSDRDARAVAADLAATTAALVSGPVTVVGHDMGAIAALAWARERPGQVRGLVLSGGGVPGFGLAERGPPHLARFAGPPAPVVAELTGGPGGLRGGLERFVSDPAVTASGSLDAAVRAYARPGRLAAALGRYRSLPVDAAANRADPRPLAMGVTAVEGALAGGAEGISATTVRALAPQRRVVVVPGAGHHVQEDRPGAFAAAVREAVRTGGR